MADKKGYEAYYRRVLGIRPDAGLVAKAAKNDFTMQEFQLLIQREDTNRFLRTAIGQRTVSSFRDLWASIFPSLGRQPGIRSLRKYLKEQAAPTYRDMTAASSQRDMYAYLSKTKLFKAMYPEFKETKFLDTLNFAGFSEYKDNFKRVMRQYGQNIGENDVAYFFRSGISPDEFEKNLATVLGGAGVYQWGTGRDLAPDVARKAAYGRKGTVSTLSKISQELEKQQSFMQSKQAEFGVRRSDVGRLEQANAY